MKESHGGRVVRYEDSDYAVKPFADVLKDMHEANERRYNHAPAFTCFCEICPDRPGFLTIDEFQIHDKSNIDLHRRLMEKKKC